MTISIDDLRGLLDSIDFHYYLDPRDTAALAMFTGQWGDYKLLFDIDLDGRFLQLRTLDYTKCPKQHEHCRAVLELLGALNYDLRVVKFGWDPRDGEIVVYADVWLEDATMTTAQMQANLGVLLRSMDRGFGRISATMATGTDPGSDLESPDQPAAPAPDDFDTV